MDTRQKQRGNRRGRGGSAAASAAWPTGPVPSLACRHLPFVQGEEATRGFLLMAASCSPPARASTSPASPLDATPLPAFLLSRPCTPSSIPTRPPPRNPPHPLLFPFRFRFHQFQCTNCPLKRPPLFLSRRPVPAQSAASPVPSVLISPLQPRQGTSSPLRSTSWLCRWPRPRRRQQPA